MSKNDCTKIQKRVHAEIEEFEPNILWLLSILLDPLFTSAIAKHNKVFKIQRIHCLKTLRFLSAKLWVYVQHRHIAHL